MSRGARNLPWRADETATLAGFLEYQRATFAWKMRRAWTRQGWRRRSASRRLTLGGMLKHMALCRGHVVLPVPVTRRRQGPRGYTVDWDADPDLGLALPLTRTRPGSS